MLVKIFRWSIALSHPFYLNMILCRFQTKLAVTVKIITGFIWEVFHRLVGSGALKRPSERLYSSFLWHCTSSIHQ